MFYPIRYGAVIGGLWALTAAVAALPAESSEETRLLKALRLSDYPSAIGPPVIRARDVNGRQISLEKLRGRVVLITFWASWCLECRPEMPQFEQLHRDFAKHGLSVIGVNVRESNSIIVQYAKELSLTFPLVPDAKGEIREAFGVIGLPTTFLIRRNGSAAALAIGARNWGGPTALKLIKLFLAQASMPSREN
ncbi:MAG: TlpA family protein disulfide reductase [Deltaproteobacteria bacterium]|nr:TlpA family protein disulfide reductase [Deltaproteobacteria bacterium]